MIKTKTLAGGVRLVTEKLPEMQAAAIGIFVAAGSAYESSEISGISHFIEHMFFKGTRKRGFRQIAEDMDRLGASFNAFTGKEYTCFHVKAISELFPDACEVLFDMMSGSLFDESEMDKERGVIIEEMKMVEDTPDDVIIDYLSANVFAGSDLESSIIGSRKSLRGIHRKEIVKYIKKQYTKDSIVVAAAGNFNESLLIKQINECMEDFAESKRISRRSEPLMKPKYTNRARDINQTHIALGIPTLSLGSKNYYAQAIVNDILGGSMSSRLFQNIREDRGLAYTVFSSPLSYTNSGMFFIYAGISLGREAEAVQGIGEELAALGESGISEDELENVKRRLKASYIFGLERLENRVMRLGKNRLLLGRNYSEEQIMREIQAVSLKEVNSFCESIADIRKYSAVSISKNKLDIKALIKGQ